MSMLDAYLNALYSPSTTVIVPVPRVIADEETLKMLTYAAMMTAFGDRESIV